MMKRVGASGTGLAFIDFPVAFGVKSHLEEAIFGIVALAAAWADHVTAPGGALAIVVFGNREGGAATAGDQEHAEWGFGGCTRGASWLGRSLTTPERRLRSG